MPASEKGKYGVYGGRYVAETLMPALLELEEAWEKWWPDEGFREEFDHYLKKYVGRPTPLTYCPRLTEKTGGAKIYLKREDLCHTGAHKVNNTVGQALLAAKMGKKRLIAETGAGQHGVATATVAAKFGFECEIFMGAEDMRRQRLNVFRMRLLGAKVTPVASGSRTLKDALNEALRNWIATVTDTHYLMGTVAGPHPYPELVKGLQSVIGREAREQMLKAEGRPPDAVVACVGGGSNAMGIFRGFMDEPDVKLVGVEAAGKGITTGKHAATLGEGKAGILHGQMSYLLQDEGGQVHEAHSISAGLDYPGVGPEHAYLKDTGGAEYVSITDDEAMEGLKRLTEAEGIIPALETAHAVAYAVELAGKMPRDSVVLINLSGRGDKDMSTIMEQLGEGEEEL